MSFDMRKLCARTGMGVSLAAATALLWLTACDQPVTAKGSPTIVTIRFELIGNGRIDYTAVADASGLRQVPSNGTWLLTNPAAAVMTIRADPGKLARCRIYVDNVAQPEAVAADGTSATCLWVAELPEQGYVFNIKALREDPRDNPTERNIRCTFDAYAGKTILMTREVQAITPATLRLADISGATRVEYTCEIFGEIGDSYECTAAHGSESPQPGTVEFTVIPGGLKGTCIGVLNR